MAIDWSKIEPKDFEKFEDIFTRVKAENLSFYRDEALKIMEK